MVAPNVAAVKLSTTRSTKTAADPRGILIGSPTADVCHYFDPRPARQRRNAIDVDALMQQREIRKWPTAN
jgi:hypothetical protein